MNIPGYLSDPLAADLKAPYVITRLSPLSIPDLPKALPARSCRLPPDTLPDTEPFRHVPWCHVVQSVLKASLIPAGRSSRVTTPYAGYFEILEQPVTVEHLHASASASFGGGQNTPFILCLMCSGLYIGTLGCLSCPLSSVFETLLRNLVREFCPIFVKAVFCRH